MVSHHSAVALTMGARHMITCFGGFEVFELGRKAFKDAAFLDRPAFRAGFLKLLQRLLQAGKFPPSFANVVEVFG